MAAIAHSLFLFVFYTSRNWFSPSGLSAMLGGHAQVTLVLATNTNTIAKIFYFRQSSPGSANCILCSQTGHFTFSYPKTLLLWPGPAFSLSISSCLQIIVSAVRNSIPAPQCIAKNGKQQESKKKNPRECTFLMETPCLQSDLDAPLNSLSVCLLCDIEFITFWFVIQDMWSYMQ